ncbi:MAG: M56 family metallopeptidase [Ruthenibacterium lactatiformans]
MAHAARQDMELACDEAVLAGRDMAGRRAYGAAVLDVLASARRRRISALTTGFASGAGETRRRFAEMLSLRKKQRHAAFVPSAGPCGAGQHARCLRSPGPVGYRRACLQGRHAPAHGRRSTGGTAGTPARRITDAPGGNRPPRSTCRAG